MKRLPVPVPASLAAGGRRPPAGLAGQRPSAGQLLDQHVPRADQIQPDHLAAKAIVDSAEIPTLQDRPAVDTDGDGQLTDTERSHRAASTCAQLAENIAVTSAGTPVRWVYRPSALTYSTGAGSSTCPAWCAS